ncbi:MAG: NAD(P)/FAD-dependent oxidoreductase, partial [Bacteroidales bacterium]|nr:NAD(P)/FAD-dependent oxidoreductase [Bacteroidales bacterium]
DGGIEGSLGFRLSRKAVESLDNGQKVALLLDLKPALSEEQIGQRIKREAFCGNNSVKYLLSKLLPRQLVAPFLSMNRQLLDMHNGEAARLLPALLKRLRFEIVSYVGFERCVVTNGGVSTKEVSQKTMESKLVDGLFFAGEVLDLDGDTGGYNLQIAFSTAVLAAKSAMSEALR